MRSRGTPRIANRFLRRARDFAQVQGDGVIDGGIARVALQALGVDELGLDAVDRRMLGAVADKFAGGPVGLETLAAVIGEESVTLEDVYEPYLPPAGIYKPHAARALHNPGRLPPSRIENTRTPGRQAAGSGTV